MVKRTFDIILSSLLLLLLAPFMLVIGVAIAVTMGTPAVFRQSRPGWRGKPFDVLKFRTMNDCTDQHGVLLPDYMRTTRFGQILRNTSIDELPQLINVLLGQMSLVGPRPLLKQFVENCTAEQLRRFDVRPGITGLAQISGRKALDYDMRFAIDVQYVDSRSFWLDIKILLATFSVVFRRDGLEECSDIPCTNTSTRPVVGRPVIASPLYIQREKVSSRDIG